MGPSENIGKSYPGPQFNQPTCVIGLRLALKEPQTPFYYVTYTYRRKLLYASLVLEYVAVGTVLDRAEFVYGQSVVIAKEP